MADNFTNSNALKRLIKLIKSEFNNLLQMYTLTNITHNLSRFVTCHVFEVDYTVGLQGAGEGPAGGTSLDEIVQVGAVVDASVTIINKNQITIKTRKKYGTIQSVNKITDTQYSIVFTTGLRSLIVYLKEL